MTQYLLHSQISGQGDTIVMLHGYLSSSQYFKHFRKRFEQTHHVVALDLLGFGQSPKPKVAYDYNDHIAAIRYTLKSLGIKTPYILLGHSMGALVALRFAVDYPADIKKLLLFNPPLFTDRSQMTEHHKATAAQYRVMLYSKSRHILWPLLKAIPRRGSTKRTAINFTDTVRMAKQAREGSYHNVIGGATAFDDLARLSVPTLLVLGQRDRDIYIENLAGSQLSPHVEAIVIDVDHHPLVRDVALSAALVKEFVTIK